MRKGEDLNTFIVPKVKKIWNLNLPEPLGPPRPVAGTPLPYVTVIAGTKTDNANNRTIIKFLKGSHLSPVTTL